AERDLASLSGGEMQRLALARILLQRPDIAILDEATSALDQAAETELLARIREHLPDMILILISHRVPQTPSDMQIHDIDNHPKVLAFAS
ncbi:MAG: ATP-binding cassette domain-containing protein, partial [Rhizobium sp.]|nr:ATP-binding cassette domain-containing protein [Rhizobium sp.]